MKLPFPGHCYCIDTSALVDLEEYYSYDIFPSLWGSTERLILEGRLIAPREVLKELEVYEVKEDPLLKFAKDHKEMFKPLDNEQQQQVRTILENFPRLVDPSKMTSDADPFVIALAMSEGCTVVASEKHGSPGGRPKIPDVCEKHGVKCISLKEFFREQGWTY